MTSHIRISVLFRIETQQPLSTTSYIVMMEQYRKTFRLYVALSLYIASFAKINVCQLQLAAPSSEQRMVARIGLL